MIRKKMILSKTANMGAYLRKMAILANSTGAVTPEEMKELKGMIKKIGIY